MQSGKLKLCLSLFLAEELKQLTEQSPASASRRKPICTKCLLPMKGHKRGQCTE